MLCLLKGTYLIHFRCWFGPLIPLPNFPLRVYVKNGYGKKEISHALHILVLFFRLVKYHTPLLNPFWISILGFLPLQACPSYMGHAFYFPTTQFCPFESRGFIAEKEFVWCSKVWLRIMVSVVVPQLPGYGLWSSLSRYLSCLWLYSILILLPTGVSELLVSQLFTIYYRVYYWVHSDSILKSIW